MLNYVNKEGSTQSGLPVGTPMYRISFYAINAGYNQYVIDGSLALAEKEVYELHPHKHLSLYDPLGREYLGPWFIDTAISVDYDRLAYQGDDIRYSQSPKSILNPSSAEWKGVRVAFHACDNVMKIRVCIDDRITSQESTTMMIRHLLSNMIRMNHGSDAVLLMAEKTYVIDYLSYAISPERKTWQLKAIQHLTII